MMNTHSRSQSLTDTSSQRAALIKEVFQFVCSARMLPGVTRIALIGSLSTHKPDPKDADLLVTITDEADLVPLASEARKLQGRALSLGRGGEVFLADLNDNYLGRICPWRQCGPSYRVSCDAIHCGKRLYLHDDTQSIRLSEEVIAEPPIELWPKLVTRVPISDDLQRGLLDPLS